MVNLLEGCSSHPLTLLIHYYPHSPMKKILLYLFTLLLLPYHLAAQATADSLKAPLRFIKANDVITWSYHGTDFREQALEVCPQAKHDSLVVNQEIWNNRQQYVDSCNNVLKELNVVGGGDNECTDKQGFPAWVGSLSAAAGFLLTGEATYMDIIERSLYNAVAHSLADSTLKTDPLDLVAVAHFLMNIPTYLYATSDSGKDLYVNLYTNATANLSVENDQFTLDQITDMPRTNQVKLRLTKLDQETTLRVHLRIPDWAIGRNNPHARFTYVPQPEQTHRKVSSEESNEVEIYVNGHRWTRTKVNAAGYVVIDRRWKSRDEIFITFPKSFRYLRQTNAKRQPVRGALAGQYGPMVYTVKDFPRNHYSSSNLLPSMAPESAEREFPLFMLPTFLRSAPQDAKAPRTDLPALPYAEVQDGNVWWNEIK